MGRPPLTERRKAATRIEIAYEAVRLFTSKGVAGTSVEEIADGVGISTRTLRRYFPTKESCVQPLLTTGLAKVTRALGDWRPGDAISQVVDELADQDAASGAHAQDLGMTLALIRLTYTEPSLRAVWLQFQHDREPAIADVLAACAGTSADDLQIKIRAALIIAALCAAAEHVARQSADGLPERPDTEALWAATRTALQIAAEGVGPG
ncbi:helix-turn-helix domain-containing protein [Streptomyces canus]|uniref:TetR/AcrR family transcriptional regulator n=1 Tax=Streptomyces canus TaxID=58343 RepID=UPI002DDA56A3|nr:helix-turn-helix domain-containing protein [Streptomyces canus]WSD89522.1 TetR/AcrR family transcriptional regulator [Streptomyces canus]